MKNRIKSKIKKFPIIAKPLETLNKSVKNVFFPGSKAYWESRYREGGTSGGGSYNQLAEFKAETINKLISKKGIDSVIEFGCGDGNQLGLFRIKNYTGLDVSETALRLCTAKYSDDTSKSFFVYSSYGFLDRRKIFVADMTMSLDVIYHLVEDFVYEKYMTDLFNASSRYVLIYSTNYNGKQGRHVRRRKFSDFVDENFKDWELEEQIKNPYPYDEKDPENTSDAEFFLYRKKK